MDDLKKEREETGTGSARPNGQEKPSAAVSGLHDRIVYELSHDLRTSLNSITGYVQLLKKNAADTGRVREYADGINGCCKEILELLGSAVEKQNSLRSGKSTSIREFSLGKLVEELNGATAQIRDEKRLRYNVLVRGIKDDHFIGDRSRLTEVLLDLVTNACRVTPEGGQVSLKISALRTETPNQYEVSFVITDNGVGMSSELQKRLFEGGRQKSVLGFDSGGIGYNMGATKQLVDQMGGTMSVQSSPGAGMEVYVGVRLEGAHGGERDFFKDLGIRRLLIIVQDPQEIDRIEELMDAKRIPYDKCLTGSDALKKLSGTEDLYDLILVDRDLEDMPYKDFCRRARKLTENMSIILLSDKPEHFMDEVELDGITGIMPKPFFYSVFRQIAARLAVTGSAEQVKEEPALDNPLEGMRFLVAEDNPLNADILKELLEMEGARCDIAGNGKAAVAMFRFRKPDYYGAILMDIQMPVENGYDAAMEIRSMAREDAKRIPILAMTAGAMPQDIRRTLECGMDAHIVKPLDIEQLVEVLNSLKIKAALQQKPAQ